MKKLKKNQGITLIALVITIIVLLLLAGISISALTGSGIFGKAKEAIEKHKYETALEKVKLAVSASYDETGNINDDYLYDNLDNIYGKISLTESEDSSSYIINVDGYFFLVSKLTGEIIKKDIEIADGEVDNFREIDEKEYDILKNTVNEQVNEILRLRSDLNILVSGLRSDLTSLQETVNGINLSNVSTATLLGSFDKNESISITASNYHMLAISTKIVKNGYTRCFSGVVPVDMLSASTVSVSGTNIDSSADVNDNRTIVEWGVTNTSVSLTVLDFKGESQLTATTTKTYVYGMK